MNKFVKRIVVSALLAFSHLAWAEDDNARYTRLINELRCLVCQNQSISESNAPLAVDLREQVQELLDQGKSDTEIYNYLTARYGDYVLYNPPVKAKTWVLWFGPFVLLAIALFFGFRLTRKEKSKDVTVDQAALQEMLQKTESSQNDHSDKQGNNP